MILATLLYVASVVLLFGAFYVLALTIETFRHVWEYNSKPWGGYDFPRMAYIVRHFAHNPHSLKVQISHPRYNIDFQNPTLAWYEYDKAEIHIDTRFVRSEKELVATLLHEICHHNQSVGGRLSLGMSGKYSRRPVEREASGFADAWLKVALKMYRSDLASKG